MSEPFNPNDLIVPSTRARLVAMEVVVTSGIVLDAAKTTQLTVGSETFVERLHGRYTVSPSYSSAFNGAGSRTQRQVGTIVMPKGLTEGYQDTWFSSWEGKFPNAGAAVYVAGGDVDALFPRANIKCAGYSRMNGADKPNVIPFIAKAYAEKLKKVAEEGIDITNRPTANQLFTTTVINVPVPVTMPMSVLLEKVVTTAVVDANKEYTEEAKDSAQLSATVGPVSEGGGWYKCAVPVAISQIPPKVRRVELHAYTDASGVLVFVTEAQVKAAITDAWTAIQSETKAWFAKLSLAKSVGEMPLPPNPVAVQNLAVPQAEYTEMKAYLDRLGAAYAKRYLELNPSQSLRPIFDKLKSEGSLPTEMAFADWLALPQADRFGSETEQSFLDKLTGWAGNAASGVMDWAKDSDVTDLLVGAAAGATLGGEIPSWVYLGGAAVAAILILK